MKHKGLEPVEDAPDPYSRALDAFRSGNRGPEWDARVEEIYPLVRQDVFRLCKEGGRIMDRAVGPEDVLQEVMARLHRSPPSGKPAPGLDARATIRKWVKTTTARCLIDLARIEPRKPGWGPRTEQLPTDLLQFEPHATDLTPFERKIAHRQAFGGFLGFLMVHYRPGARYLEALQKHPGLTRDELARILGVTRTNLDKIHSRTAKLVDEWMSSSADG